MIKKVHQEEHEVREENTNQFIDFFAVVFFVILAV